MPENVNEQQQQTQTAEQIADAAKAAGIDVGPDGVQLPPGEDPVDELPSEQDAPEGERPEWLPEKFKSVEEMAKAYAELEKKQGEQPEQKTQQQDGPKIPDTAEVKAAVDIVEKAGLKFEDLNAAYAKDGKLTDEQYAALEKQSIPRAMVDSFIAGQQALAQAAGERTAKAAYEVAGGEAKYGEAVQWAAKNLDADSVKAFNKAIDSNDAASVKLAVSGLMAKFNAAGGNEPSNIATGERAQAGGYASKAEMQKDMGDPRYAVDPAFRRRVEQKLARTTAF